MLLHLFIHASFIKSSFLLIFADFDYDKAVLRNLKTYIIDKTVTAYLYKLIVSITWPILDTLHTPTLPKWQNMYCFTYLDHF